MLLNGATVVSINIMVSGVGICRYFEHLHKLGHEEDCFEYESMSMEILNHL